MANLKYAINKKLGYDAIFPPAFSLVELLVVIAIIGILSTIVFPTYKTYIIRSKFTELIALVEPYQLEATRAFYTTGSPPANRTDTINSALVDTIEFYQCNGIELIHVHPKNFFPEYSSITKTPLLFAGSFQNGVLTWGCFIHPSAPIPAQYLPSNCQTAFSGC